MTENSNITLDYKSLASLMDYLAATVKSLIAQDKIDPELQQLIYDMRTLSNNLDALVEETPEYLSEYRRIMKRKEANAQAIAAQQAAQKALDKELFEKYGIVNDSMEQQPVPSVSKDIEADTDIIETRKLSPKDLLNIGSGAFNGFNFSTDKEEDTSQSQSYDREPNAFRELNKNVSIDTDHGYQPIETTPDFAKEDFSSVFTDTSATVVDTSAPNWGDDKELFDDLDIFDAFASPFDPLPAEEDEEEKPIPAIESKESVEAAADRIDALLENPTSAADFNAEIDRIFASTGLAGDDDKVFDAIAQLSDDDDEDQINVLISSGNGLL